MGADWLMGRDIIISSGWRGRVIAENKAAVPSGSGFSLCCLRSFLSVPFFPNTNLIRKTSVMAPFHPLSLPSFYSIAGTGNLR